MFVQKLQEAGVSETEIIKVTGHKDTWSLKSYSELSAEQHMKTSSILQNLREKLQASLSQNSSVRSSTLNPQFQ